MCAILLSLLKLLPSISLAVIMTLFLSRSLLPPTPALCCGVITPSFSPPRIFVPPPSPVFFLTVHLPSGTLPKLSFTLTPRISPSFLPVVASPTVVALNASSPRRTVAPLATSRTPRPLLPSSLSVANWTTVLCRKQLAQPCVLALPGSKKARLVPPISSAASDRVPILLPSPVFAPLMVLLSLLPLLVGH